MIRHYPLLTAFLFVLAVPFLLAFVVFYCVAFMVCVFVWGWRGTCERFGGEWYPQ